MIRFYLKEEIQKPAHEVFRLIKDRGLMHRWQPGLLSDEAIEKKEGRDRYKLIFKIGRRNIIMTETILKDKFPEYEVMYDLKGIRNIVRNKFEASGQNTTLWKSDASFQFKGIMKLVGNFMRSGLEQQTRIIMKNFKNFAERQ